MKINKFLEREYGLTGNPFLDDIAREIWLETWVNRQSQLKQWQRVISKAASPQKNYLVFIIGSYGRGKSLSLLKVIQECKQYNEILPIYLNFQGEQRARNPGLDFIFRMFKSIDFKSIAKDKSINLVEALERIPDDLEEVKAVLKSIYMGEPELSRLALYFLRGEMRPTTGQLRSLGIIRKIDDIEIAKEYLAGILNFIKGLGIQTILFAVDEFEYLFSLVPRAQQSIYFALLRGLYDFPMGITGNVGNIAKIAIFLAISEDGWRKLQEMEKEEESSGGPIQPLLDRVDAETVLVGFDRPSTRNLIEKRLRYNRAKGKYEADPLIPFTEDFIRYIYEITYGEPRKIIWTCGQVLDAGLEKGVNVLNKKIAEELLRERESY